jgi:hypothetical protein
MKKILLIGALTLIANAAIADTIKDGTYSGGGRWKTPKINGEYQITTTIKQNTVSSTYNLPGGDTKTWQFTMGHKGSGFFDVVVKDQKIGEGYCLDDVMLCHYAIKWDALIVEETLTLQHGVLYKYGSKNHEHGRVVWQEKLNPANG